MTGSLQNLAELTSADSPDEFSYTARLARVAGNSCSSKAHGVTCTLNGLTHERCCHVYTVFDQLTNDAFEFQHHDRDHNDLPMDSLSRRMRSIAGSSATRLASRLRDCDETCGRAWLPQQMLLISGPVNGTQR